MKWLVLPALLLAQSCAVSAASTSKVPCEGGYAGIGAKVIATTPANAVLVRRPAHGKVALAVVDGLLCKGDTLELKSGSPDTVVEVYEGRKTFKLPIARGYVVKSGVHAMLARARGTLDAMIDEAGTLATPRPRPNATASRGPETETEHLFTVNDLADQPPQRIAADLRPILTWRGGERPYSCQQIDAAGIVLQATENLQVGWCVLGKVERPARRLMVLDASGRSVGWNITVVPVGELPRPDWVPDDTAALSAADRTAWAIWMWRSAGPEWRLQSLAMLEALADHEWLASYVADSILAGEAVLAPH